MDRKDSELLLENTMEIASLMLQSGAEARRIEGTVLHIMGAYGFEVMCANAVTSMIDVTVKSPDGWHYNQSIRVLNTGTDLVLLERLNALARKISLETPPVGQLRGMIEAEKEKTYPLWLEFIGFVVGASAFSAFFGGDLSDALSAGMISVVVFAMNQLLNRRLQSSQNRLFYTFTASLLSGILALFLVRIGIGHHSGSIMIGNSMLFMPGLSIVNGVRELFYRDIITGMYRLVEALIFSAAIAGGFGAAILLLGGVLA